MLGMYCSLVYETSQANAVCNILKIALENTYSRLQYM
jgi:hypothetical protein